MTLLVTWRPGVGKTTVLRAAARRLTSVRLAGFYTEEFRAGSERIGFRSVMFAGQHATRVNGYDWTSVAAHPIPMAGRRSPNLLSTC